MYSRRCHHCGALTLKPQESRVLAMLALGFTNHEIAVHMSLSVHTVKTYVSDLIGSLGARDRTHAAVIYVTGGAHG